MLTVGKQRQESTVGNVVTVWMEKRRDSQFPKKLYVPKFLSPFQKMESIGNGQNI